MLMLPVRHIRAAALCTLALLCVTAPALAAPEEPLFSRVQAEKPALIETLRQLVNIESGSRDKPGLDQISALLAERLTALGGKVEFYQPNPQDTYTLFDTPKEIGRVVIARFAGSGTRRIMLLGHMDTVYQHGTLARRPFRLDARRAYGPGVADDKSGLAIILHTLALLKSLDFHYYGTLTVVMNADEEISSPGARKLIERLGAENDYVFSCEPTSARHDEVAVATSGIGSASLTIHGKSAHAGVNPELGRNAIVELAYQIMQTRDLSDEARGIKFNWTLATGGMTRNVIPDLATASADVRVRQVADLDVIERAFRERVKKQLIPDAVVEPGFERRRVPLVATEASRAAAKQARDIYAELGLALGLDDSGNGGGTDASFAALSGKPVTLEGFGLLGFGYHSSEEEYVELDSIEPRLYLLTRMVMDASRIPGAKHLRGARTTMLKPRPAGASPDAPPAGSSAPGLQIAALRGAPR
jgi:glutamate carboxypeptidase